MQFILSAAALLSLCAGIDKYFRRTRGPSQGTSQNSFQEAVTVIDDIFPESAWSFLRLIPRYLVIFIGMAVCIYIFYFSFFPSNSVFINGSASYNTALFLIFYFGVFIFSILSFHQSRFFVSVVSQNLSFLPATYIFLADFLMSFLFSAVGIIFSLTVISGLFEGSFKSSIEATAVETCYTKEFCITEIIEDGDFSVPLREFGERIIFPVGFNKMPNLFAEKILDGDLSILEIQDFTNAEFTSSLDEQGQQMVSAMDQLGASVRLADVYFEVSIKSTAPFSYRFSVYMGKIIDDLSKYMESSFTYFSTMPIVIEFNDVETQSTKISLQRDDEYREVRYSDRQLISWYINIVTGNAMWAGSNGNLEMNLLQGAIDAIEDASIRNYQNYLSRRLVASSAATFTEKYSIFDRSIPNLFVPAESYTRIPITHALLLGLSITLVVFGITITLLVSSFLSRVIYHFSGKKLSRELLGDLVRENIFFSSALFFLLISLLVPAISS